jgi:hypothetical protein
LHHARRNGLDPAGDLRNGTQIVQAPGYVVIRNEMIHEARVIPLDDSPRPGPNVRLWLGVSRGRFDGGTLVIETTNFTHRTGLGGNGNGPGHSEALKLTERLEHIDAKSLRYEFTTTQLRTRSRGAREGQTQGLEAERARQIGELADAR